MADSKISALPASTTPLAGTEVLPVVQSGTTKQVSVANLTAGRAVSALSLALTGSPLAATSGGTGSSSAFTLNGVVYANSTSTLNTGTGIQFDGTNLYIGNNPISYGAGYANFTTSGSSGAALWVANIANTAQGFFAANTTATQVGSATNHPTQIWVNNTNPWTFDTSYNLVQKNAAKGVNFTANTPAAGMTSQLLNWYEEGTWTPNQGAGLTLVGAFSSAGTYTRIGRQVFIRGSVSGDTSVAVASAGAITTNLPYSAAADATGTAINAANNASSILRVSSATLTAATAIAATTTITFSAVYSV